MLSDERLSEVADFESVFANSIAMGNGVATGAVNFDISAIFQINFFCFSVYFTGMVSLYYGYLYTYFMESETKDIRPWLIGVLGLTTALSLIGAFKSLFNQIQMAAKTCRPADESAAENENRHDFVDFHTKMTGASE